jgi:MYXO-CTERM domain-containing protein
VSLRDDLEKPANFDDQARAEGHRLSLMRAMTPPAPRLRCVCLCAAAVLSCVVLSGARATAAVQEPNGVSVPATVANGEITLQSFFDSQMEGINAVADAATDPGAFLPLCDFQATLVLSQSQAAAGLAWYNQPAAPTGPPATVYPIGAATLTLGQTITSADIRSSPNYAGALIGFALMKNMAPVYYSEYKRNVLCSGCTAPDYWKMALAYQSRKLDNTYYLAFEDWEGANSTSWLGNDGDFNDKVFRFSGVTCDGGGAPCYTGALGVCSTGVTQCQVGGGLTCVPLIKPTTETCDNLDNDCNGMVDDGPHLCDGDQVCVRGVCVPPCGLAEFDCVPPFVCQDGLCIDAKCIGKVCDTGQVCRDGTCVGGCEGIQCPLGQDCELGACVDLCAGVPCPGAVCEKGACVTSCACRICPTGQACAGDGHCVDEGCQSMSCGAGQVCRNGGCVDSCTNAICPGNAACHDGRCDPPMTGLTTSRDGSADVATPTGASGGTSGGVTSGTGGASAAGGAGGAGPDAGAADAGSHGLRGTIACGCATADTGGAGAAGLGVLLALAASRRRRDRARKP